MNQTVASYSTPVNGGRAAGAFRHPEGVGRGRVSSTYRGHNFGGVSAIESNGVDFEDEEAEFRVIFAIIMQR